jgi:hypothetical protein
MLAMNCPSCGAKSRSADRVCSACGAALAEPSAAVDKSEVSLGEVGRIRFFRNPKMSTIWARGPSGTRQVGQFAQGDRFTIQINGTTRTYPLSELATQLNNFAMHDKWAIANR